MALQALNRYVVWPETVKANSSGSFAVSNAAGITTAGDYYAGVWMADRDMTIAVVGISVGSPVGSPTTDARIETVDSAGLPSGTLWAANTNAVSGVMVTGWTVVTLTAPATILRGQLFAVKLAFNVGGFTPRVMTAAIVSSGSLPFDVNKTAGGAVTRGRRSNPILIAVGSSLTSFYYLEDALPLNTITSGAAFNNTNAAKRGLRFQIPYKARCAGFRYFRTSQLGNYNIDLFDDSGVLLASQAIDGDSSGQTSPFAVNVIFSTPFVLAPATWYRAVIEPVSATNVDMTTLVLPNDNYRSAMPGGLNCHYTTFASGSWIDTATNTLPMLDLLFDQVGDDSGGGGGSTGRLLTHPGMTGGLRG